MGQRIIVGKTLDLLLRAYGRCDVSQRNDRHPRFQSWLPQKRYVDVEHAVGSVGRHVLTLAERRIVGGKERNMLPAQHHFGELGRRQPAQQRSAIDRQYFASRRVHQPHDTVAIDQHHPIAHGIHQLVGSVRRRDLEQSILPRGIGIDEVAQRDRQSAKRKYAKPECRQEIDDADRAHQQPGQQQQPTPGRNTAGPIPAVETPIHPDAQGDHRHSEKDEHPACRRKNGVVAPRVVRQPRVHEACSEAGRKHGGRYPCSGDRTPVRVQLPGDQAAELILDRNDEQREQECQP